MMGVTTQYGCMTKKEQPPRCNAVVKNRNKEEDTNSLPADEAARNPSTNLQLPSMPLLHLCLCSSMLR